jgi:nucleoside 2-deoxyribosyltransferase
MRCFVISPIGERESPVRKHADKVFNYLIKPAMDERGIEVARADHIDDPGRITDRMIEEILTADLCVAVLTGANPNVFYEVALAQAAGRPLILMLERGQNPPFDIRDYQYVEYDLQIDTVEETRAAILRKIDLFRQGGWTGRGVIHDYLAAQYAKTQSTTNPASGEARYDLFVSSPMTSLGEADYAETRALTLAVITTLRTSGRYSSIYYSGQEFEAVDQVAPASVSARSDLDALRGSRAFLLIYPKPLITSSLVEAGYALALRIPSYYFVRAVEDLPYMLQEAAEAYEHVHKFRFRNEAELLRLVGTYLSPAH